MHSCSDPTIRSCRGKFCSCKIRINNNTCSSQIRSVLLLHIVLHTWHIVSWTDQFVSRLWLFDADHETICVHMTNNSLPPICLTYRCAMLNSQTEQASFVHVSSACIFDGSLRSLRFTDSLSCPYCTFGPVTCHSVIRRNRNISHPWGQHSITSQSSVPYAHPLVAFTHKPEHRTVFTESRFRRFLLDCVIPLLLIFVNMTCMSATPLTRIHRISSHHSVSSLSSSSSTVTQSNSMHPLPTVGQTDHNLAVKSSNTPMNATHRVYTDWFNNPPLIKVYMRSERTRRSLEYYMSNGDKSPLFILSKNRDYLTIRNDGKVHLAPDNAKEESLMTIGVVVEPAQLKNYINRVSSFKPIDNARVIVRRFRTNICLCMAPSGVVGTERLINHTVTDNCAWRLRVSRYGVGLEHLVYLEDPEIVPDSSGHGRPEYQVATLSASLTGNGQLSSGWMHRLWQPEATWSVYNDDISKILEKLANRSTNNMQVTTEIPTVVHVQTTESITADQPTANTSDDHTPIEVGGKKVLWFQAPAQYIIAVQRNLQKNHCIALMYNLSSTVQREMLASLKIINNFRAVYRQVEAALNTSNSSSMPFNEFPVPSSPSLATLFDQWLLWTDQRWVSKIKRMAEKSNTANPTFPPSCALSYSRSHGEPSSTQDPYVSAMLKKHEMTKIYYNLFLRVQHLAHWSSAERRNWFSHPRLPMLLRYLGLSAPSAVQLRQAIYVLRRYLPVYEPRPTDSQASANNYGVAGTFSIETLNQILQNRQQRGVLLNRAMALKFEELRAWPRPASRTSHKVLEHTPVSANSLRMEIRQMDSKDYCYTYLVSLWFRYVRGNLPITCVN